MTKTLNDMSGNFLDFSNVLKKVSDNAGNHSITSVDYWRPLWESPETYSTIVGLIGCIAIFAVCKRILSKIFGVIRRKWRNFWAWSRYRDNEIERAEPERWSGVDDYIQRHNLQKYYQ